MSASDAGTSARTGRPTAALVEQWRRGRTVSFELYPPRSAAGEAALEQTVDRLLSAAPDFVSVTYGASGSSRDTSRRLVRQVAARVRVMAHLTCLGAPPEEVRAVAEELVADGVRDLLALRGDPPAGAVEWVPAPDGLQRASQLVELLRDVEGAALPPDEALTVAVAASPTALRKGAPCGDLLALRAKQDAGADVAITQVFFEPDDYTAYVAAARDAGVTLPLLPGIVPLVDPQRLRRLEQISGVAVPTRVLAALERETDDAARRAAGRSMAAELVDAVLDAGAPGVHLYTFNQHGPALDLLAAVPRLAADRRPVAV